MYILPNMCSALSSAQRILGILLIRRPSYRTLEGVGLYESERENTQVVAFRFAEVFPALMSITGAPDGHVVKTPYPKRTLAGLPPLTSLVPPPPSHCHAAASYIDNIGISIAQPSWVPFVLK